MAKFSLIRPLDQPLGTRRLLQDLKDALQDDHFTRFWLIVAYAKSGPFYRLQDLLEKWSAAGKTSAAIFGLDQQGTSQDALELALTLFDRVYVTQEAGITFHPKIYLFKGECHARVFVGSNNFTVGGTERNFEAAVHLEFDLPESAAELATIESAWASLLPTSCVATRQLDADLLAKLVEDRVVREEKAMRTEMGVGHGQRERRLAVVPESPLPSKVLSAPAAAVPPATGRRHVIQIKPHHNGEVLLSFAAVQQNPAFFNWPFQGETIPKRPGNSSYPQLVPDPVVNIAVFGAGPLPVLVLPKYSLNTVYYKPKKEIRITASPLVGVVPEYSVMIMERSSAPDIDYEITIHTPDSPDYQAWVATCNQAMPGGGKEPRKYGWL